jgi:hypothetical protein
MSFPSASESYLRSHQGAYPYHMPNRCLNLTHIMLVSIEYAVANQQLNCIVPLQKCSKYESECPNIVEMLRNLEYNVRVEYGISIFVYISWAIEPKLAI